MTTFLQRQPLQRQPLFIAEGDPVPDNCLCVDGLIPGTAATYSHWQGTESPQELRHDLSTGIVLRAAIAADTYMQPFTSVANNHIDVDGLLSMAVACDPTLTEHCNLLLSAAAYGDFCHFPTEAGARLALCLHQYIVRISQEGTGWEQRSCEQIIPRLREIIIESAEPDAQRDQQIQRIQKCQSAIAAGEILIEHHEALSVISTSYVHGHQMDGPTTISQEDDLPPWALWDVIPSENFQLLCLTHETGTFYQLDAPRHSWAQTWQLPSVVHPCFSGVARIMQEQENKSVQWVYGSALANIGFVCELASSDEVGSSLAASSLSLEYVRDGILECMQ